MSPGASWIGTPVSGLAPTRIAWTRRARAPACRELVNGRRDIGARLERPPTLDSRSSGFLGLSFGRYTRRLRYRRSGVGSRRGAPSLLALCPSTGRGDLISRRSVGSQTPLSRDHLSFSGSRIPHGVARDAR